MPPSPLPSVSATLGGGPTGKQGEDVQVTHYYWVQGAYYYSNVLNTHNVYRAGKNTIMLTEECYIAEMKWVKFI